MPGRLDAYSRDRYVRHDPAIPEKTFNTPIPPAPG